MLDDVSINRTFHGSQILGYQYVEKVEEVRKLI